MSLRVGRGIPLFCALALVMASTPLFAQLTFSDFSDVTSLTLNGTAAKTTNANSQQVLRLTRDGVNHVSGTAWFNTQQSLASGFTTVFTFQISHSALKGPGPADGLAFVIQNSSGAGQGLAARGGSGGAIGYGRPEPSDNGTAIPNSLAVEFDTFQNGWDPNGNHVAVQSCGTAANSQDHTGSCNLALVSNLGGINLADGNVHTVIMDYDPGTLRVFLDNPGGAPIATVSVNLATLLSLTSGTSTWVGFTGATGGSSENNDILSWTFTPGAAQTAITQNFVANSQTPTDTNYVFGSYNKKFEYTGAGSDTVKVTAIPIDQTTFHDTRLVNTPFDSARCLIYDGTGGRCVLFRVECTSGGNDCDNLEYTLFNNFNTTEVVTGACVLKTPIGTNTWQNIIQTFSQTRTDPTIKSGSKGFSDFVLAEHCTQPPTVTINSPADGATYFVGQPVSVDFTCTPDPNAPQVTATCSGTLNGNPATSPGSITFTQPGPGSLTVTSDDSVLNHVTKTANFTVGTAPALTSSNSATFVVGTAGSFPVTTSGSPAPAISTSGLPSGVGIVDNGDGTATIAGIPAAGTGGVYNLTITATNGGGSVTQTFTLTVNQGPAITSANATSFATGTAGSFTVTSTGFPRAGLAETGALPSGVSFVDNGNGTATLAGIPSNSGTFPIAFTASNTVGTVLQSFVLTVNQSPAFTSANNATFTTGGAISFTVTTTGFPAAGISESGALPAGVNFVNNGNGTATLSGTPTASGIFQITFTASNVAGTASQNFVLTINRPAAFTSGNSAAFQLGVAGSFMVSTVGFPTPAITESGVLPGGVAFVNNGNGTASLSGTPTTSGVFPITLTASNVAGTVSQSFTLTVVGPQVSISPTSLNFGSVTLLGLVSKNVTITNAGSVALQINRVTETLGQADWDDFTFLSFCPSSLPAGKSCVITVLFFADDLGTRTSTLNIVDSAPNSPQTVSLTGTVVKKGK